jgi:hypothetical protein
MEEILSLSQGIAFTSLCQTAALEQTDQECDGPNCNFRVASENFLVLAL